MSKMYEVQARFGKEWVTVGKLSRHTDALHYVKFKGGENYPLRIVRVVKTVVFEDKSHGKNT